MRGTIIALVLVMLAVVCYGQNVRVAGSYSGEGEIRANNAVILRPGFVAPTGSSVHIYTSYQAPVFGAVSYSSGTSYVLSEQILRGGISDIKQDLGADAVRATVMYSDGLGRDIQRVSVGASGVGGDLVESYTYRTLHQAARRYQPYSAGGGSGVFRPAAIAEAQSFYQAPPGNSIAVTGKPYTEYAYDGSSLEHLEETAPPGDSWQMGGGHTLRERYESNGGEVRRWEVVYSADGYTPAGANSAGAYGPGQLYKQVKVDEQGHEGIYYTDKQGRKVCQMVEDGAGGSRSYATVYYVYDYRGNLAYVITPGVAEGIGNFTHTGAGFEEGVYAYLYDGGNRLAQRKQPGRAWEYFVYNRGDKLVYSQNGEQRGRGVWAFNKYEATGRLIMDGEISGATTSFSSLQQALEDPGVPQWETRTSGVKWGYTDNSLPRLSNNNAEVFTIHWYDDYTILADGNALANPYPGWFIQAGGNNGSTQTMGKPTVTANKVLPGGVYLLEADYYDEYGRVSRQVKQHQLSGVDITENTYSFTGELQAVNRRHYTNNQAGSPQLALRADNTYDHWGRHLSEKVTVNGVETGKLGFAYDAIGQLEVKTGGNYSTYYNYNPRGWRLGQVTGGVFNHQLQYETGRQPQFNGNISTQSWSMADGLGSHYYNYSYDNGDRLVSAENDEGLNEWGISYDKMGNLLSLNRRNVGGGVQNMFYSYIGGGSRVQSVTGVAGIAGTGNYNRTYSYNGNGAIVGDGQVATSYNQLGLAGQYTGTAAGTINYNYSSSGEKISRRQENGIRYYIGGVEHASGDVNSTNAEIDIVNWDGGILVKQGESYIPWYYLTDQLGSVRVVYNTAGEIMQAQDYYAFGKEIPRKVPQPRVKYNYNGKELQEALAQLDYGARFYDPIVARWASGDPLGEKLYGWGQYTYTLDNPNAFIDPDGAWPYPIHIRAFHPSPTFGGGFAGDNRGFSTLLSRYEPNGNRGITSRLQQSFTVDPAKHIINVGKPWSDMSSHPLLGEDVAKDAGSATSRFTDGTAAISTTMSGKNPLTARLYIPTPAIDVHSQITLVEDLKKGTLRVTATMTGDGFPSAEMFIGDTKGQQIMLIAHQYQGNPLSLVGDNHRPMGSVDMTIKINGRGEFIGTLNSNNILLPIDKILERQSTYPGGALPRYTPQPVPH